VLAAADDELTYWAMSTAGLADEPVCAVAHDDPISALAASPTDPLVATADDAGRMYVWSLRDLGGPIWSHAAAAAVTTIAWRPDGTALAVGTTNGDVSTWAVVPGALV